MILNLQSLSLPALSAACHPDSARTPFIPPDPIPGHDDRIDLALAACLRVGRRLGPTIATCDGLESPSEDLSAQREVSSLDEPQRQAR